VAAGWRGHHETDRGHCHALRARSVERVIGQDAKSLSAFPAARGAFYVGAGSSFNWTDFDQALQGVSGVTNVLLGPDLVAEGQASGPFFNFDRDESGFAPDFQAGYTLPFAGGAWQAGLKFTYKLANIDSKENVSIPQEGSFTTIVGPPITIDFPGFVPITPAKIELKHQFVLCPRSAARSARSRSVPAVAPHCSTSR
jgi:hypothetical protein